MKRARQVQHSFLALSAIVLASFATPLAGQTVSQRLHRLALRAKTKRNWAALRRYARLTRNNNDRGLAYFVLGYREYNANLGDLARSDFRLAIQSNCRLKDLAEYYEALADQDLNRDPDAVQVLQHLLQWHPDTAFRLRATTLLANLLIQGKQEAQAIRILSESPGVSQSPGALLALGKAYQAESDNQRAASIFEQIYSNFPLSSFADSAAAALEELRPGLGQSFPFETDQSESARAAAMFYAGQYGRALKAYDLLFTTRPRSSMADLWRLGRARCLLSLGRYDQAAVSLLNPMEDNQVADAERLRVLVHIYERADDEPSMLNSLDELYRLYPRSSSYASALFFAGDYFCRHGFWQTAAPYYQRIAQTFPNARWDSEAVWWITWYKVLEGDNEGAAAGLESYLQKYPNSYHVPAALYWLARTKEEMGFTIQAQGLYAALESRFPSSYYGLKARRRLRAYTNPNQRASSADGSSRLTILTDLKVVLPPLSPPVLDLPEPASVDKELNPVAALNQLGLPNLANEVLSEVVRRLPKNPQIFFALARLRARNKETALALFAARSAVPNYQDYSFTNLPREEWKLLYPRPYWTIVRAYARIDGLDPYLVMGLIRQESAFDPRATSSADARGLMQIRPGTAAYGVRSRWRRRRVAGLLYDPRYNIRVSSGYLRGLFATFQKDPGEAIAAYNAGDVWVKDWITNGKFRDPDEFIESIPFSDTKAYVESVIRDAAIYRSILTGTARFSREPLQQEN
ncbi:MAG TPA: transglycosylase SLT domain-containing protein [Terriglobia bacterium]|nr:transglycosylase SLT domain-containing protein [Terriglobia bacterium]